MGETYEPELGQAVFGRDTLPFDLEAQYPQASHFLRAICELLPTPEGRMSGDADYADEIMEVHRYWWGDDDAPEANRPNFKCGDVAIKWYKHCGRGMSTNKKMSAREWQELFIECLQQAARIAAKGGADYD